MMAMLYQATTTAVGGLDASIPCHSLADCCFCGHGADCASSVAADASLRALEAELIAAGYDLDDLEKSNPYNAWMSGDSL